MERFFITLLFTTAISLNGFSQTVKNNKIENRTQKVSYSYTYISVEGKLFSKKLKVNVDFGDTPEQLKACQKYWEILTNKKSYAAILNYMSENGFELIQTFELTSSYKGSGGTTGVVFLMKKKNKSDL